MLSLSFSDGIFSFQFNTLGIFYYWAGAGDSYKDLRGSIEVVEGQNERELQLSVSLGGFQGRFEFNFSLFSFLIFFILAIFTPDSLHNESNIIDSCQNSNVNLNSCPQVASVKGGYFKYLSTCDIPSINSYVIDKSDTIIISGK